MGKNVAAVVIVVAAVAFLGYTLWSRQHRRHLEDEFKKQWGEMQASQEIICDSCGASTEGLTLSRNEASHYQMCPECGGKTGRPVVYYMCMTPECNRQLVKVRNVVWEEGGVMNPSGDPIVCPQCGRPDNVTPDFLILRTAEKYAKETEQEFP